MALIEIEYDGKDEKDGSTFRTLVERDVTDIFFNESEFALEYTVDGRQMLCVLDESDVREHSSHWEAGAKQNFDTGLYNSHTVLYIAVRDYGAKPKVGKELVIATETWRRTYRIKQCEEESGIYRMTLERARQ